MDSELLTTNSNSAPVVPAVEVAPAAAAAVDSLDGGASVIVFDVILLVVWVVSS